MNKIIQLWRRLCVWLGVPCEMEDPPAARDFNYRAYRISRGDDGMWHATSDHMPRLSDWSTLGLMIRIDDLINAGGYDGDS